MKIECGMRLKECRQEAGMTQKELADKINLTYQSISNIECGKRSLTVENARACAKVLNVRMEYLLCEDNIKKNEPIFLEFIETMNEIEKVRNFAILHGLFNDIVETEKGIILVQNLAGVDDFFLFSDAEITELCTYVKFILNGWAERKFSEQNKNNGFQDYVKKLYNEQCNKKDFQDFVGKSYIEEQ